ncbi:class II fructose-bisphosphate aldolase, partial [[Clostridium] scindens]
MKIVNGYDLLAYAKEKNLLLPAFNTTNLEMTKAIIQGLHAVHLPGMVQISSNNLHLSNPEVIAYMMREFLKG